MRQNCNLLRMIATKSFLFVTLVNYKSLGMIEGTEFSSYWNLLHLYWSRFHKLVNRNMILCKLVAALKGVRQGVLTRVFDGPTARILDQAIYSGDMEQTIPTLVESTGLSFKTAQKAVLN